MERSGSWRAQVHPEDVERIDAGLRDLSEGEERALEYRFLGRDGGERWVRDSLRAVRERPGGPLEVVGVLREAALERMLRRQVSALEERIWESQRLESLGALAGGVAHDFNNLITTILTTVQLLDEDGVATTPSSRRDLRMIREAAERGSAMVRQILRFAARREQAGPVDVNRVVHDLEGILCRRLGPGVRLELRLGGELPIILSDPAQLEQVILNLVVNACEAMPGGGDVRIETARLELDEPVLVEGGALVAPGNYVRLTVCDTGPGVPSSVRDRIFEPFFSTKVDGISGGVPGGSGGGGFGLSTVQRIVRGHGGGVVLEDSDDSGAAFHVYLPIRDGLRREAVPEMASTALPPPTSGVRILVVEDDPNVRELMRRMLVGDGHAVATVATAADGLRAFDGARPPFDAVLIDLVLPDRPGGVLARALRRRRPDLAVLYVSGYGEQAETDREPGGFLAKPFTLVGLRDALQRALAEAPEPEGDGAAHASREERA